MPASYTADVSGIAAALESNFKQQLHREAASGTLVPSSNNSQEDAVTDSWVDQILGNELFTKKIEYTCQKEQQFNRRWSLPNLMHLKKETCPQNGVLCNNNYKKNNIQTPGKTNNNNIIKTGDMNRVCKKDDELEEPRTVLYKKERVRLGWLRPPTHHSGLANLGNTCYLNSSLQALFHIPALGNWLEEERGQHLQQCQQSGISASFCSLCAVISTYVLTRQPSQQVIKPNLIVSKLKCIGKTFTLGRQEDAHEFIKLLLEHMERSYLLYRRATKLDHLSRQTTPLNQIFGGYLRQQVTCPACGHVSTTFSHFQDLVLDIRSSASLDQALDQYFRQETLDAHNCYRCERCKKKVPATKGSLIERPPNVLLLQLKRFTFNGCKIGKHINIDRVVDLTRFLTRRGGGAPGALRYRLVSMVVHLGGSQHGGHYIACAEGGAGHMLEFDDCSVRSVGLQSVLLRNPYILFYELIKQPQQPQSSPVGSKDVVRPCNNATLTRPIVLTSKINCKKSSPLSNGTNDLGEVVPRTPTSPAAASVAVLPPPKQRERITFDMKAAPLARNKMIVRTNVPLLNPKLLSSSSATSSSPTSSTHSLSLAVSNTSTSLISSTTPSTTNSSSTPSTSSVYSASASSALLASSSCVPSISTHTPSTSSSSTPSTSTSSKTFSPPVKSCNSVSKLNSIGYLLSTQKKVLTSIKAVDAVENKSLVPYVDDSDASENDDVSIDDKCQVSSSEKSQPAPSADVSRLPSKDDKTPKLTCTKQKNSQVSSSSSATPVKMNQTLCKNQLLIRKKIQSNFTEPYPETQTQVSLPMNGKVKSKTKAEVVSSSNKTSDGWVVSDSSDDGSNASNSSTCSGSTNFTVTENRPTNVAKKIVESADCNGWKVTKRKEINDKDVNQTTQPDKNGKASKGLMSYISCISGTEDSPLNASENRGSATATKKPHAFSNILKNSLCNGTSTQSPANTSVKLKLNGSKKLIHCNGTSGSSLSEEGAAPSMSNGGGILASINGDSTATSNGTSIPAIRNGVSSSTNGADGSSPSSHSIDKRKSGDVSTRNETAACVHQDAPAKTKLAWDRHVKGDLAYTLTSHRNKHDTQDDKSDVQSSKHKAALQVVWHPEGDEGERALHALKSSSSYVFGAKVSTWDGGDSELDVQKSRDVAAALRRTEHERYNDQLDEERQRKRKTPFDLEATQHKKRRFDTYVRHSAVSDGGGGGGNPNLIRLGGGANGNGWNAGYGGDKKRFNGGFHYGHGGGEYRGSGRRGFDGHRRGGGRPWRGGGGKRWGGGPFNLRR
ncbi:ubiquitin carboxyl-terminal hydrolase 36 [Hyalella azteca]|uniref:Ubiquitin carboxyl-terminal hydrolase 36 n=1 Tax=Hyalella azteca TaxID=294128 RepID=A0A8B7NWN5_HYAAZ|nr:ubiquitin carboxyl-terminal hydrolase 36 [Hyalella azteca]XP_018018204.1 ubiquitin carboxyl-terminal hydrolase 36 [Hyalella azteca]